ncbi:MAG: hypothetical protein GMKNLPBB_01756 [Myxococcota bacterium]|nr:hypothetical protein [Myxococcota bacterium]
MRKKVFHLTVRDIMSNQVITLSEDEDLGLAEEVMKLGRIRHLPVTRGGELRGLVTHRDLLRASISSLADMDDDARRTVLRRVRVSDIMNRDVHSVSPDMKLIDVCREMISHKYGCLPVVEDGRVIGIVTEADFVKLALDILLTLENAQTGE